MDRRKSYKKKPEKKMSPNSKVCPHCGNEMRCRGSLGASGNITWKCKNKKCGRTLWEKKVVVPPIPLTYK